MLQKILLEQVLELLGMSAGDLPTSGWTPMARLSRGSRAVRALPARPAARTDRAQIPPRLRVSPAAAAPTLYKSAPGSDDETLSPPSFALCAEGTLKPQEAKAARTEQVGARLGHCAGGTVLCPPLGTPGPPLCSRARLQDVAGLAVEPSRRENALGF